MLWKSLCGATATHLSIPTPDPRGTHPLVPQLSATHTAYVWENQTSSRQKSWVWFTLRLRNLNLGVYFRFTCLNSTHMVKSYTVTQLPLDTSCLLIKRFLAFADYTYGDCTGNLNTQCTETSMCSYLELHLPLVWKYWHKSLFTTAARRLIIKDSRWQYMNLLLTWFTHRLIYVLVTSL